MPTLIQYSWSLNLFPAVGPETGPPNHMIVTQTARKRTWLVFMIATRTAQKRASDTFIYRALLTSAQGNYELYWSTSPMLEWPFLRQIMSHDRFMSILSFFHACDNSVRNDDKLYKVGPKLSILLPAWKKAYYSDREICLDESMIAFKGRAPGRVYQPKKNT